MAAHRNSEALPTRNESLQSPSPMARSVPQRLRAADASVESWVEISSQPSSSSLSSIGDDAVSTSHVHDQAWRRRRRQTAAPTHMNLSAHANTSSQEEYEESESEEDRFMSSSTEHMLPAMRPSNIPSRARYDAVSDSSDDENATALGRRTNDTFTPQPNAFSHPPSPLYHRLSAPASTGAPPQVPRPSLPARMSARPSSHDTSTYQADHDAVLRASLSTLLSIGAAAARGLPKRQQNPTLNHEPMGLRMVPESELAAAPSPVLGPPPSTPSPKAKSSPSISSQEEVERAKRKSSTGGANGKMASDKARAAKKKRVQLTEEAIISPTLLTWVMSAGVVVLVSVVGFGAGYVIGREVGRGENLGALNGSLVSDGNSCGREVVRGSSAGTLRRFKWGVGSGVARGTAA